MDLDGGSWIPSESQTGNQVMKDCCGVWAFVSPILIVQDYYCVCSFTTITNLAISDCTRSIIVDNLRHQSLHSQDHTSIGFALVYLKYNDPEQSLNNILGSLLKQLVQDQVFLCTAMSKLYESYGDLGISPSSKDISEALLHSLSLYFEVFLIVDALDECSNDTRWGMIEALQSLTPNVCILILSRPRGDIGEDLKDFKRLEAKANKADIELFIDAQIQKYSNLRRIVERSPSLRGDIEEGVVRTAREMCAHHPNVKSISTQCHTMEDCPGFYWLGFTWSLWQVQPRCPFRTFDTD